MDVRRGVTYLQAAPSCVFFFEFISTDPCHRNLLIYPISNPTLFQVLVQVMVAVLLDSFFEAKKRSKELQVQVCSFVPPLVSVRMQSHVPETMLGFAGPSFCHHLSLRQSTGSR
jgi:hypothetical protein